MMAVYGAFSAAGKSGGFFVIAFFAAVFFTS